MPLPRTIAATIKHHHIAPAQAKTPHRNLASSLIYYAMNLPPTTEPRRQPSPPSLRKHLVSLRLIGFYLLQLKLHLTLPKRPNHGFPKPSATPSEQLTARFDSNPLSRSLHHRRKQLRHRRSDRAPELHNLSCRLPSLLPLVHHC